MHEHGQYSEDPKTHSLGGPCLGLYVFPNEASETLPGLMASNSTKQKLRS